MNRTLAVSAAAALLVGLGRCDADPPAPPPPSTAASPTTSAKPATVLTAPTYRLGPMPVTPTWQPPGEDGRPAFADSRWFIRYRTASLELTVQRGEPTFGDLHPQTEHIPVQMLGFEGYRSSGVVGDGPANTLYVVTTPDGLSVIVAGSNADVVRRYVDGLRRQPMPMAPPFELALLPERFAPSKVTSYAMEFEETPEPADPNAPTRYLGVHLWQGYEFDRPATAIATTVNGNPAEVVFELGMVSIRVMLPGRQVLVVDATAGLGLDQRDLERIAAGVTITADATAWT